jgi:hypothetical protein
MHSAEFLCTFFLLLVPAALQCTSDDAVAPSTGSLAVTTRTIGLEPDPDGYTIQIDDGEPQPIGTNATLESTALTPGEHTVGLGGIAANCSLSGDNPRSVSIPARGTATVSFVVTCSGTVGLGRSPALMGREPRSRESESRYRGIEPASQVLRHGTEIASRAAETDVTIGPHEILGGLIDIAQAESREGLAAGVDQCVRNRARGEAVQKNQAGVAIGNGGELRTIPTLQGSTQQQVKVWAGELVLQIGLCSIARDLGIGETITRPGATL